MPAVVDIGSNSGRVVVVALSGMHLEVRADDRAPLRLAADLHDGRLSQAAVDRAAEAVRDFAALAAATGATETIVVATSAVRESSNAEDLIRRVAAETGLSVEVLTGDEEARFSFLGAVHGLPVDHGLLVDVGGGSMELAHFRDRKLMRSWTLPLGALRLSGRFLSSDPPATREVRRLCEYVAGALHEAGVAPLAADERLVGTGGTLRTLAKLDRHQRSYVIPRIHGYEIARRAVEDLAASLASRKTVKRGAMRGLSADRADSIVGGAFAVATAMQLTAAAELIVSGQGLREGIALSRLLGEPQPSAAVRAAAVEALVARFGTWNRARAARRVEIAATAMSALLPDSSDELNEMVGHAATVLDVGRSLDHYNRSLHAASIVVASDLAGFSHGQLATIAFLIRKAEDHGAGLKALGRVADADEATTVAKAATVLALADELDARLGESPPTAAKVSVRGREVIVRVPAAEGRWTRSLAERVRLDFGRKLRIESAGGGA